MTRGKVLVGILLCAALLSTTQSCITKDYKLGSSLIPTDQDVNIYSTEIDLPVELRLSESIQSYGTGLLCVGSINSPIFGKTRSEAAFTVTPTTDSIQWGKNPEFESAYLSLTLSDAQIMEDNQEFILQNLYVHRLTSPLDSTMYFSDSLDDSWYDPEPISDGCAVYDGGETILIPIKESYMKELFNYTMEQMDSTEYFINHFYGMYLRCDDVEDGSYGGRLNDFSTSDSYLSFTLHYTDEDDGLRKDKAITFDLADYWAVNRITSDAASLVAEGPEEAICTDGLCGVKPVVNAKELKKTIESWIKDNNIDKGRFMITRAALEFPFEYTGESEDYDNFPTNLFPCRRIWDSTGEKFRYLNPIDEIEDSTFDPGSINRSLFYYKPDAGQFIQELVAMDEDDVDDTYDLWMMPTVSSTSSTTGDTYYYADVTTYYQGIINGTKSARHPVLKLSYVVIGE